MNTLIDELKKWLDTQLINSETIGSIRSRCFVPWDSQWNSIVRDETAKREVNMVQSETLTKSTVEGTLSAFKTLVDGFPAKSLAEMYLKTGGVPIKGRYSKEIKQRDGQ